MMDMNHYLWGEWGETYMSARLTSNSLSDEGPLRT